MSGILDRHQRQPTRDELLRMLRQSGERLTVESEAVLRRAAPTRKALIEVVAVNGLWQRYSGLSGRVTLCDVLGVQMAEVDHLHNADLVQLALAGGER